MSPLILERKMHTSSLYFCFQRSALEIMTEVKTHIPLKLSIPKHSAEKACHFCTGGLILLCCGGKNPGLQVERTQRQSVTAVPLTGGPQLWQVPHLLGTSESSPESTPPS